MQQPADHEELQQQAPPRDFKAELDDARTEILRLRRKQTDTFIKIANCISTLQRNKPDSESFALRSWLSGELGFSSSEATAFASFGSEMSAHSAAFLDARTPPEVLAAMARCHPEVQAECLRRIDARAPLDAQTVSKIRRTRAVERLSPEQLGKRLRSQLLRKSARRFGSSILRSFAAEANELLALADRNMAPYQQEDKQRDRYLKPADAVVGKAAEFHRKFEPFMQCVLATASGSPAEGFTGMKVVEESARQSWYVLQQVADMQYLRAGASKVMERSKLRSCAEFLSGRWTGVGSWVAFTSPRLIRPPTFVDLNAGVGGTVLGLMSAGFEPAAIFTRLEGHQVAISFNRLLCKPVLLQEGDDIPAETVMALSQKGVDLITSGLPLHYQGTPVSAARKAAKAVREIRPKFVLFEVSRKEKRSQSVAAPFEKLGYQVSFHSMDVKSHRVPQEEKRHLLFGARDGLAAGFEIPAGELGGASDLSKAIGDLLAAHVFDDTQTEESLRLFQQSVAAWKKHFENKLAPELPRTKQYRKLDNWSVLGIDIRDYCNAPPTPVALSVPPPVGKAKPVFCLNADMLKRIQTFPDEWMTASPRTTNAQAIANAFPPVAMRIVGLALLSAVTGAEFDYRRAAIYPMLQLKRVGPYRSTFTFPGYLDSERIVLTSDMTVGGIARVTPLLSGEPGGIRDLHLRARGKAFRRRAAEG